MHVQLGSSYESLQAMEFEWSPSIVIDKQEIPACCSSKWSYCGLEDLIQVTNTCLWSSPMDLWVCTASGLIPAHTMKRPSSIMFLYKSYSSLSTSCLLQILPVSWYWDQYCPITFQFITKCNATWLWVLPNSSIHITLFKLASQRHLTDMTRVHMSLAVYYAFFPSCLITKTSS